MDSLHETFGGDANRIRTMFEASLIHRVSSGIARTVSQKIHGLKKLNNKK